MARHVMAHAALIDSDLDPGLRMQGLAQQDAHNGSGTEANFHVKAIQSKLIGLGDRSGPQQSTRTSCGELVSSHY